jgi:HK97 family phage major capsid protein
MKTRYQEVMTEVGALNEEVKSIFDRAGDEALDRETYQRVITNNKKIEELEIEAKELLDQAAVKEAASQRSLALAQPANALRTPHHTTNGTKAEQEAVRQSIGDIFVNDPGIKAWMEQIAPNGRVPDRAKIQSPAVQVKTLITGLSSTSGGAFVVNDRLNIIEAGTYGRPLTIRNLITVGTTNSDTVEYVRQGTHTNNAATVAEATATSGGTGAKPESAMALSVVTETVKTIAHWIPATRRALADAGQMRTLIDSFLRYGLDEELEDQIINGNGVGEDFIGVLNTPNTTAQAWDTNILTTTRKARTKVRTTGRAMPNGYVLHPNDWQTIDLLQDNEARYFFGGPSALGTPRLWGLPVIESEAMPEGTGVVTDWKLVVLWDREQAQILVSDSHSDFFIRNLIAILAELRAAMGCLRPSAIVEMDLTA